MRKRCAIEQPRRRRAEAGAEEGPSPPPTRGDDHRRLRELERPGDRAGQLDGRADGRLAGPAARGPGRPRVHDRGVRRILRVLRLRGAPQLRQSPRHNGQRDLDHRTVEAPDEVVDQLSADRPGHLRLPSHPLVRAGLRAAGHLLIHGLPLHLQVLRLSEDRALSLSDVDDRPDGHGLPDADGDDGALRRRLPSPEGALALHVRQGAHRPLRHRLPLRLLQSAKAVGGRGERGAALQVQRHDILHRPDADAREQALHSHLRALVLLFHLLRIPVPGPRYLQHGYLRQGAQGESRPAPALPPPAARDRPGDDAPLRGDSLPGLQRPATGEQRVRERVREPAHLADPDGQPPRHLQQRRQLHHLRDIRAQVQADLPQALLPGVGRHGPRLHGQAEPGREPGLPDQRGLVRDEPQQSRAAQLDPPLPRQPPPAAPAGPSLPRLAQAQQRLLREVLGLLPRLAQVRQLLQRLVPVSRPSAQGQRLDRRGHGLLLTRRAHQPRRRGLAG